MPFREINQPEQYWDYGTVKSVEMVSFALFHGPTRIDEWKTFKNSYAGSSVNSRSANARITRAS